MNRNEIYNNLLDLCASIYTFKEKSRRPKLFSNANNKPAIYLEEQSEVADSSVRGSPIKWTFNVNIIIYTSSGNSTTINPYDELNNIIDLILELFNPNKIYGGVQKINGLVESCYVDGAIEKFGNDNNMTGAIAIIPVKIIVANR